MRELSQLRQMIQGDPKAAKAVAELARQMQHLDPSRFQGNPAMVEQMRREVLSSVDGLELQ
jgi:sulfur transfer protein SufE